MPILALVCLFAVGLLSPAHALTHEEIVRELIGVPVYTTDGREVGTVADIALGKDFETLVMKADPSLGFGERTLRVPGSAFIALRGAVVLDLPSSSMDVLLEYQPGLAESN